MQLSSPLTQVERSGSCYLKKIVPRQFVEQPSKLSFENQVTSFIKCALVQHLKLELPRWLHWQRMVQPLRNVGLVADQGPFFIIDSVCCAWARRPWGKIVRTYFPFTPTDTEQAKQLIPAFCSRLFSTVPSTDFSLRRIE